MNYEQYLFSSPVFEEAEPINELNLFGFNIGGNKKQPQPEQPKKSYMEQRRERAKLLNGYDDGLEQDIRQQNEYNNFLRDLHDDAEDIRQRNGLQTPDYLKRNNQSQPRPPLSNTRRVPDPVIFHPSLQNQNTSTNNSMPIRTNTQPNRISPVRTTAIAAKSQIQNNPNNQVQNNSATSTKLEEIKQRLRDSGYRNKNKIREEYNVSQYSPYLFQSPMNEEYISDEEIIDYLNENYTYDEINEIYNEFLIETFGYDILDEDYYNYIVDQYGGEDVFLEFSLGNMISNVKSFFTGKTNQPATQPQAERKHLEKGYQKIGKNAIQASRAKYMDVRDNKGIVRKVPLTQDQFDYLKKWKNEARKAQNKRNLEAVAAATPQQIADYHKRKQADREYNQRLKISGRGW